MWLSVGFFAATYGARGFAPDDFGTLFPMAVSDFLERLDRFTNDIRGNRIALIGPSYAAGIETSFHNLAIIGSRPDDMVRIVERYGRDGDYFVYVCTFQEALPPRRIMHRDFLPPWAELFLAKAWVRERIGFPIGGLGRADLHRFIPSARSCLDDQKRRSDIQLNWLCTMLFDYYRRNENDWDMSFVEQLEGASIGRVLFVLHPTLSFDNYCGDEEFGKAVSKYMALRERFRVEMTSKDIALLDLSDAVTNEGMLDLCHVKHGAEKRLGELISREVGERIKP